MTKCGDFEARAVPANRFRSDPLPADSDERSVPANANSVTFVFSKKTALWDDKHTSLLELAEAHGLSPDFSCRSGICGTCACELISGDVVYFAEPLDVLEEGMVLICCSRPAGDVKLKI